MNKKGAPVVYFDIGCEDAAKTQDFYENVFGWEMTKRQHNIGINTNSEIGIQGAITSLGHEPHQYIMFYVEVESISATIEKITSSGGKHHIGPLPTGEGQMFAWVNDPGGNMIGLVSDEE